MRFHCGVIPMRELLFISGSAQGFRTRSSAILLKEAVEQQAPQMRTDLLDLAVLQMQFFDGRPFEEYNEDTRQTIDAVMAASVLVVASPVYQGSIPGSLKNLFDLLPRHALANKGAVMLSLIGSNRYYLSPVYHLRPVLEELDATVLSPWLSVEEKHLDVMGQTRDADLLVRMRRYASQIITFAEPFLAE